MSVCIVDSSILCEILRVPNKCGNPEAIYAEMEGKVQTESLLLPMSAIIETGNHIGQNGDGRLRRSTAQRFIQFVKQALQGDSPFTPTPLFKDHEALLVWLEEFPDWAKTGSGLGDLTIRKEFERQCDLNPMRRVGSSSSAKRAPSHVPSSTRPLSASMRPARPFRRASAHRPASACRSGVCVPESRPVSRTGIRSRSPPACRTSRPVRIRFGAYRSRRTSQRILGEVRRRSS